MPEVAGDAAIFINPRQPEDLFQAMLKLTQNPSIKEALKKKGFKQVAKFSWKSTAIKTLEVYNESQEPLIETP